MSQHDFSMSRHKSIGASKIYVATKNYPSLQSIAVLCHDIISLCRDTILKEKGTNPRSIFVATINSSTTNLWPITKDQNIGKYGYIGNWILRIYRKYR